MEATDRALADYELDEWTLTTGSGAAMTACIEKSV